MVRDFVFDTDTLDFGWCVLSLKAAELLELVARNLCRARGAADNGRCFPVA
jgi:hypothetical protein